MHILQPTVHSERGHGMGDCTSNGELTELEEYRILGTLLQNQHTRFSDFLKTVLTLNTILIGVLGLLYSERISISIGPIVGILSVMGVVLNLFFFLTFCRLSLDDRRLAWQLRDRESRLKQKGKGIFRQAYKFYFGKQRKLKSSTLGPDEDPILTFPGICHPARFRASRIGPIVTATFGIAYLLFAIWTLLPISFMYRVMLSGAIVTFAMGYSCCCLVHGHDI